MTNQRIALVTGANKGIGYEVVRALAQEGVRVHLGARRPALGEAAAARLVSEGLDVEFLPLDVCDEAQIAEAVSRIEQAHGRLDILVNNAAAGFDFTPPSEVDLAVVRSTFETNTFAPIRMIQAFLPLLRRSSAARIVNVSSDFGSLTLNSDPTLPHGQAISLAYPASKTALNQVTVQFAKELRGTPILINSVDPGFTDTDMVNAVGLHSRRTPADGARAVVGLALLDDDGPSGGYHDEHGVLPW